MRLHKATPTVACCCSESVLMRDFEEMEAEIMDQLEVEALP